MMQRPALGAPRTAQRQRIRRAAAHLQKAPEPESEAPLHSGEEFSSVHAHRRLRHGVIKVSTSVQRPSASGSSASGPSA